MAWTPERKELALRLWSEGQSPRQIADQLGEGVTRNSVIGIAYRARIPHPLGSGNPEWQRKVRAIPTDKRAGRRIFEPKLVGQEKVELVPEVPVEPVSLLDLEPHHCRWPVGKLFCGANKSKLSYCAKHYKQGHQVKTGTPWALDDPRRAKLAQARRLYNEEFKRRRLANVSGS